MAQLVEHHLAKVRVAGSNPVVRSIVCQELVGKPASSYQDKKTPGWRRGQVVRQRPAKPSPPVRIRASPPIEALTTYQHADMAQLVEHHLAKVRVAGSNPVVRSIVCQELVGKPASSYQDKKTPGWRRGQVVRQRPAKPSPPVRIRASPPIEALTTYQHADMAQLVEHHLAKVRVAGSNPVVRSIVCQELVGKPASSYQDKKTPGWRRGQVVRQRPAKPSPPVRIRASPPIEALTTYQHADMAQLVEHHLAKVRVAGSNPVVRSIYIQDRGDPVFFIAVGEILKRTNECSC